MSVAEALYTAASDNDAWLNHLLDTIEQTVGPHAACGLSVIREQPQGRSLELADGRGHGRSVLEMAGHVVENMEEGAYREFWYPTRHVLLGSSVARSAPPGPRALYEYYLAQTKVEEFVGLIGHPAPGWSFVLFSSWHHQKLEPSERLTLERLRIHVESVLRLRMVGGTAPTAVISPSGRIEDAQGIGTEQHAAVGKRVRDIEAARTARGRSDQDSALGVWKALVEGQWSLVEQEERGGKRSYLAFENSPAARRYRSLDVREASVLSLSSQGLSGKQVAYALGIAPTLVSRALASAQLKLGFRERADLLRCASALGGSTHQLAAMDSLSAAEVDVLELVQLGHSNRDIAALRGRSVATVANQVSSILRKTGAVNRRALLVGATGNAVAGEEEESE
ncbi:MAG: helix-turn-helix transcriptional regulator [Myxococcales bacterium]